MTGKSAELVLLPQTTVPLDRDKAEKVIRLVDSLEDLDDWTRDLRRVACLGSHRGLASS